MNTAESPAVPPAVPPRKFKLKIVQPERANEPYTDSEVELILSKVPTRQNVALLARALKRTRAAISTIYALTYSGNWLKQTLVANNGTVGRTNVHMRIASVKDRLGIIIGHQPKAQSLTIGQPAGY